MDIFKKLISLFCVVSMFLIFSATSSAEDTDDLSKIYAAAEESEGEPSSEEEEYEYEEEEGLDYGLGYKRIYSTFGFGGHYFARKDGVDINGTVGAYYGFGYRFSKVVSVGFDTYYGWLVGSGNSYWSSFNPSVKIFPMAYKNPNLEPFIFIGGHAFEGAFGNSSRGKVSVGQGGFLGFGFRWYSEGGILGLEAFVRASALYMQRPTPPGGRGLAIPIFLFVGAVY